jgi:hypothetical protein
MNTEEKEKFIKEISDEVRNEVEVITSDIPYPGPLYALVRVGCIECGVPSGIVGVFNDATLAALTLEKYSRKLEWFCEGENRFQIDVIHMENLNVDTYVDEKPSIRSKDKQKINVTLSEIDAIQELIDQRVTSMSAK